MAQSKHSLNLNKYPIKIYKRGIYLACYETGMKKQLLIIGTTLLVLLINFSGCLEEKIVINKYSSAEDALNNLMYTNDDYNYGFNPPEGWCIYPGDSKQIPSSLLLGNYDVDDAYIFIYPWEEFTEYKISSGVDSTIVSHSLSGK